MRIKTRVNDLPVIYDRGVTLNCLKQRQKEKHGNNSVMAVIKKRKLFIPCYRKKKHPIRKQENR